MSQPGLGGLITRSDFLNKTHWWSNQYNLSNYNILMKKPKPGCRPASSERSSSKSCWQTFAKTLAWSSRCHKEYHYWTFLCLQDLLLLNRFKLQLMPPNKCIISPSLSKIIGSIRQVMVATSCNEHQRTFSLLVVFLRLDWV